MRKSMFLAPFLGFAMLGGCTTEDRVQRHEQAAAEHRQNAQKDIRSAREHAGEELAKADDEHRAATADERAGVREGRTEEVQYDRSRTAGRVTGDPGVYDRQRVAGRVTDSLEKNVRDQLGDDWTITERPVGTVVATRVKLKPAASDLDRKVGDRLKSIRDDKEKAGVMANYHHEVVSLRGRMTDCKDAAKMADDFAKIDGVNRIVVEVTCVAERAATGNMARPYTH